ncbi:alpha-amylase family glycosyl hydrolase [Cognatilysobacter tabacisoli]|uniref:alpha-amylase family glycosyl hydrolase n=1 Tax=Cognatilysobacter tabacisoli TaxID=2315424 RepID=UPI00130057D9|nr:alpha-amylase family glycosyl hydrolase [Lysobacter tabacisoli]
MRSTFPMREWPALAAVLLAVAAGAGCVSAPSAPAAPSAPPDADAAAAGPLHVPSPDWRDQVIYFVMTDRFADGDRSNNDQGAGEYDPADNARWSGGDLRGIAQRLDYIRGLGATAVWVTPPVANQWWNPRTRYGGYHGYWAVDFKAVDAHYGTLDDYRALSRALHGAGMYLVQDVVVNHTANFFEYDAGHDPADPTRGYARHADTQGRSAPVQPPFDRNDPRDPDDRAAGIYHWTPTIRDFGDRTQELTWQLAGLDDLATDNPAVRRALRDAYGFWIREAGVDAFRVDTAYYVTPEYFTDFLHSDDPAAPGIAKVAAATGRRDFHVFGEGFGIDRAYDDAQARKIDAYMRAPGAPSGTPPAYLPGMINFPLHGTLLDVFARGHASAELGHRIESMMKVHADPWRMPTFVDNHDVDRFLASGDEAGLKQALLAMLTLPGIPTIYYGTEQGLREQRAALFAGGVGSGGRDRYDTGAPLYRYLQRAIALRRSNPVFSRGTPTVIGSNAAAPGALAYRMDHGDARAIVAFNSAPRASLMDGVDTGLPPGTVLRGVFAIQDDDADGAAPELVVGDDGRVTLPLAARAGFVWLDTGTRRVGAAATAALAIDAGAPARAGGDFTLRGSARGVDAFRLVVDGNLDDAITVRPGRDGRWQATVDTSAIVDGDALHRVVAWDPGTGARATAHEFRVAREWALLADVADPAGDDAGPAGRYVYPTDPDWQARPLDLRRVRVFGAGGALKVEITTNRRIATWNGANGFDHVAYTLFVGVPGRPGGATVMPLQNGTLPGGMRWHVRARAHGWSNALFASDGASAAAEGTAITPVAALALGPGEHTVTFTVPASALGKPASLSGVQLFVNTWDYDGGYRGLTATPGGYTVGGGDGRVDPLWMDDSGVITLP